ncbi:SPOR domain-containing protein [Zhongshania guokunii]|uniref:SPOR domain-containing protein n=1 Tax=Zhongshania guokunii TaxID=641783 RepID=A0ABV3U9Y7_9GAMM
MMRQRLIGALVLLCGGVILWSLLFTGPANSKLDRHSQIPAAPQIEPLVDVGPEKPEGILPADTVLVPPQPIAKVDDEAAAASKMVLPPPESGVDNAKPSSAAPSTAKPTTVKPASTSKPVAPSAAPQKPGLDEHGLPRGWVVQVGVFGNSDNAQALKKSLQSAGYKTFIDSIQRDSKRLHRVLVGPVLSEDKAISQQQAINKRFNVKSIVNRFEP